MCIFDSLREKSPIIKRLARFFNSPFYPALFAALCAISGVSAQGVYLPIIFLLTAVSIFAGLFSDDLKVFIVPAFLIYYAIGLDVAEDYYTLQEAMPTFAPSSLLPLVICLSLLAITLIYKLFVSGALTEMVTKRGIFFWGIVFLDVTFLTKPSCLSSIILEIWIHV